MLQQRVITGVLLVHICPGRRVSVASKLDGFYFCWCGCARGLGMGQPVGYSGAQWARWLYAAALIPGLAALWLLCDLGGQPARAQVQPWLGLACVFWSLALFLVKYYPSGADLWRFGVIRALMGWLILGATWLALIFLKTMPYGWIVGAAAVDLGGSRRYWRLFYGAAIWRSSINASR